jgi:hypothetical protein
MAMTTPTTILVSKKGIVNLVAIFFENIRFAAQNGRFQKKPA